MTYSTIMDDDISCDESDEYDSQEDDTIQQVKGRTQDGGKLYYTVLFTDGRIEEYERGDLWDDAGNSQKIEQWDRIYPISWDATCVFCEENPYKEPCSSGCEECVCDCGRKCRMLQGVNYGCTKHPVI